MTSLIRNVCVYLFNKHGYVMLLKSRSSNRWMTPGGRIEESEDNTPFAGMMREFREETNFNFPLHNSKIINTYRWRGDTMVYLMMMNHRFPSVFEKTNETVAMRFVHFSRINNMHNLRACAAKSFRELGIENAIRQAVE